MPSNVHSNNRDMSMSQPARGIGMNPQTAFITADFVRRRLEYDLETGVFTWRPNWRRCKYPGGIAGSFDKKGYRQIKIGRVVYKAHRLAWLYVTGKLPVGEIDHINGVKHDNRFSNLRDVSVAVNRQNLRASVRGAVPLLGVSLGDKPGTYRAVIKLNGKTRHLGHFDSAERAHEAYVQAKRALHEGCTI